MARLPTIAIHDPEFPEREWVINLADFDETKHRRWGEAIPPPPSNPAAAASEEAAAQRVQSEPPARKKPGPKPKNA